MFVYIELSGLNMVPLKYDQKSIKTIYASLGHTAIARCYLMAVSSP